jgi:hypothetical protein
MFWGGIRWARRTSLWALHGDPDSRGGGVTGRKIQECLEEMLPTIAEPGDIFIQDNAPTHTASVVQDWLLNWAEENGVTLLDWPPYSPDLNPIENVWKLLKERICKENPSLSTMPKNNTTLRLLIRTAITVWEAFEDDLFNELVISLQRRLKAVIAANGWYTKY